MNIGIPKEIFPGENRVAAVPETVMKMIKAELKVKIETDAGLSAFIPDADYDKAGAEIQPTAASLFSESDVVLKVQRPLDGPDHTDEINLLKEKSVLICPLSPMRYPDLLKKLNAKKITAFSLDLLPRIARAQSMDILSSMSNLAGYKSIIMAADHLPKIFPMMTTAAGTILPAKVIVIGAGVAGLQAIATAHRLGAVVLGFDTRPITAEQVKSLGADFVSLETTHEAEDAAGYAKAHSAAFYQQEQNIIEKYLPQTDVIVTTALIPGKPAPLLITEAMVKQMKPGSVIVDLAVEQGGNCELVEPGKIVIKHQVVIIGVMNIPSTMPLQTSQLYSKNIFNFLNYILPQLKASQFDFTDDIIKGCLITHDGETIHPLLKQAVNL
ncbi:MAG: Re/Si-specific NAD(P)(+) transhydrogenase subunit alpha [Gammaproteobacteria bacterium]|nr:Re/Si-specific NAD(P)(+) transhydrogenase subunit alpha [Gammaproteobacteria bacterium]